MMEKRVKVSLGVTIAGFVILVLSVLLGWVGVPLIVEMMINKEVKIEEGTFLYDKWRDIPIPVYMKAYVFNITNAQVFLDGDWSAKPIVKQLGPYVFRETRQRYDITPHPETDTISYRQNITFNFVPEMSVGPASDVATVINAPLIAVASILSTIPERFLPFPHRSFMELLMGPLSKHKILLENVNIRDIVFGVRLNWVYDVILFLVKLILGLTFPPELAPMGNLGWHFAPWLNKNGTNSDGLWEVYSGVEDNTKINTLKSVDGNSSVPGYWGGDCNNIKGGDGIFFPPFVNKEDKLWVFVTELARSLWVTFEEESEYEGISTYRFRAKKELFMNPTDFPENQCYCVTPREPLDPTCAPSGVLRMRSSKTGAPVVASKPHFLEGDDILFQMVEGLEPNITLHDTFLDLVPTLGVPLHAYRRAQVSIETQSFPTMGGKFTSLPWRFWPYMWVEEGAAVDGDLLDDVKSLYVTPMKIATIGKWVGVALGVLGTVGGGFCLGYFLWWKK